MSISMSVSEEQNQESISLILLSTSDFSGSLNESGNELLFENTICIWIGEEQGQTLEEHREWMLWTV